MAKATRRPAPNLIHEQSDTVLEMMGKCEIVLTALEQSQHPDTPILLRWMSQIELLLADVHIGLSRIASGHQVESRSRAAAEPAEQASEVISAQPGARRESDQWPLPRIQGEEEWPEPNADKGK